MRLHVNGTLSHTVQWQDGPQTLKNFVIPIDAHQSKITISLEGFGRYGDAGYGPAETTPLLESPRPGWKLLVPDLIDPATFASSDPEGIHRWIPTATEFGAPRAIHCQPGCLVLDYIAHHTGEPTERPEVRTISETPWAPSCDGQPIMIPDHLYDAIADIICEDAYSK